MTGAKHSQVGARCSRWGTEVTCTLGPCVFLNLHRPLHHSLVHPCASLDLLPYRLGPRVQKVRGVCMSGLHYLAAV